MGLLDRLKQGLRKTRDALGGALVRVVRGRKLDEELLEEIEETLLRADVGVATSGRLIEELREAGKRGEIRTGEEVVPFLKQHLAGRLASGTIAYAPHKPTVILVVGVNGSGKTTSIAKLAGWLKEQGKSVVLGAGDTFRAAAVEQLTIWSRRLGVEIVKQGKDADPAAVAFDAADAAVSRGADVLVVDTAGRLHTQEHLMRELEKIRRVLGKRIPGAPHETLLVLDATTGQNAVQQARRFHEATPVTGIILAKLDGTARGGAVLSIKDELDLPVKFIGVGEKLGDIEVFDPAAYVEALFS
ncbi:MAG TPA: signal recognition particle-docking protein FtsY [Planctomycetota bacterium]|nr:signal recognition particle-docking protein FtsY [Planctomycetota bacterium]